MRTRRNKSKLYYRTREVLRAAACGRLTTHQGATLARACVTLGLAVTDARGRLYLLSGDTHASY